MIIELDYKERILLAEFAGYVLKTDVAVPTMMDYENCPESRLNELDRESVWVLNPTEEFDKYKCVCPLQYELFEFADVEEPFEDYSLGIQVDANMVLMCIEKLNELFSSDPYIDQMWEFYIFNSKNKKKAIDIIENDIRISYRLAEVVKELIILITYYNEIKETKE